MSSSNILRLFPGPQSPETSSLSQNHKSKEFSSSQNDKEHKSKEFSSPQWNRDKTRTESVRDKARIIYNKTAYGRDAVIILLIKTRTELDIPLFGRISFKDVAVTKALYACLSNSKKTQYKAQAEQAIRSFLEHIKVFFNR
jgi:hypothetical protein